MTTLRKICIPEAEAIEGAKRGLPECFESLYHLHKRRIYSLCLRMTRNIEEAEDSTQEVFFLLHRKIGTYRGDSALSTWLYRLAVNVVLMNKRKKSLPEVSLEDARDPYKESRPKMEFGLEDMLLAGSVDRLSLERAIEHLAPGYRIFFVLHDIEGFEHIEIAEMLGCSIGNSKSQLHKARLKLRELLRNTRAEKNYHKAMIKQEVTMEIEGDTSAVARPIRISGVVAEEPDAANDRW